MLWHCSHDRLRVAQGAAEAGAQMLQHDRVAFLRHDRADLDKAVVDTQRIGLLRRPHQQVVGHAAEVDGQRLHGKGNVSQVFTAADGVLRAEDDAVEAEQFRHAHRGRWGSRCRSGPPRPRVTCSPGIGAAKLRLVVRQGK